MGADGMDHEHEGGGLGIHAVVFVAVNLLLIAIWALFAERGSFSEVPTLIAHPSQARAAGFFPIYVMIFWGAGLLIHAGIVLVTAPRRWRARRAKARARRERRERQATLVGALGDNVIGDAAVAGIRMVEGDKAAKQVKRKAGRQGGGSKAKAKAKNKKAKNSGDRDLDARKVAKASAAPAATEPAPRSAVPGAGAGRGAGRRKGPVAPAADSDAASRHWVAVLFTDIVDSTPLNESLGDDAWSAVLAAHRRIVRGCLDAHRGTEVGTQGDGFLLRFDVPDDAAACAMALQRGMAEERLRTNHPLHVRMGIHAGEVVHNDDDLVGRVINLAARVTSAAGPDEIMVTEPFADHLSPGHVLTDRGLQTLKGFDRPRHLMALLWDDALDEIVLED